MSGGPVASPAVRIEAAGVAEREGEGWRTTWRVVNADPIAIRVVAATAPHSKFRGEMAMDLAVPGAEAATFRLVVQVDGAPGSVIENAFVILLIQKGDERWRVLARLRVRLDADGRPQPHVETITTQRVGFSGEL